MIDRF
jgi:hypothetical protein